MGKVFSWDEIEKGKVPQLINFSTVMQQIRNDLTISDGVIGGILFGSFLWNTTIEPTAEVPEIFEMS